MRRGCVGGPFSQMALGGALPLAVLQGVETYVLMVNVDSRNLLPLRSWCGRTMAQHSMLKIVFNISENERRTINTNHLAAFTVFL